MLLLAMALPAEFLCPESLPGVANATLGQVPIHRTFGAFGQPGNVTLNFTRRVQC